MYVRRHKQKWRKTIMNYSTMELKVGQHFFVQWRIRRWNFGLIHFMQLFIRSYKNEFSTKKIKLGIWNWKYWPTDDLRFFSTFWISCNWLIFCSKGFGFINFSRVAFGNLTSLNASPILLRGKPETDLFGNIGNFIKTSEFDAVISNNCKQTINFMTMRKLTNSKTAFCFH